jgi:uroporphyrinogen-III synthase
MARRPSGASKKPDPSGPERDVEGCEAQDLTRFMSSQRRQALVTRPHEESQNLAAALARRDVGALIEPMMEVQYRVAAALDLTGVQAILCTSANGVRALARATGERGLPLLAVGEATAARARAESFTAVASAGGAVTDLVRLAAARLRPQHGRLLHVAGNAVAGDLVGAMRAHGFTIERSILYEARPIGALSSPAVSALRRGIIEFALFFSPRTAAIFGRLAGIAGVAECSRTITALAISAAADAVLAELPWRDRRVAGKPNQQGLLDALDAVLAERRRS